MRGVRSVPSGTLSMATRATATLLCPSDETRRVLRLNIHGVEVAITANWPRLNELVRLNYWPFEPPGPSMTSLDVFVNLWKRSWSQGPRLPGREPTGAEERWGAELYGDGQRTVAFETERATVRFTMDPKPTVRASFEIDRRSRIASLYREVPSWEETQRMMRLAINQPVFHILARSGLTLLHASAAALDDHALVITGLNGSGKSSLCFSLLDRFQYMADNYVLWDGRDILGVPTALRLPRARAHARFVQGPVIFGKHLMVPKPGTTRLRARPRALIIVTRGSTSSLQRLSAEEGVRQVRAIHDLTPEFPRSQFPRLLAMDFDYPEAGEIARTVPTFHLTMDRVEDARDLLYGVMEAELGDAR